jgi:antitoxin Phd
MAPASDWKVPAAVRPKPQDYAYDLDQALAAVVGFGRSFRAMRSAPSRRMDLDGTEPEPHILAINSSYMRSFMARPTWSVQDAKNRFSEVVEAARRKPQTVTKHGKPAVVVVAADDYERLRQLERAQAPSFAQLLLAIPQDGGEFLRLQVRPRDVEF